MPTGTKSPGIGWGMLGDDGGAVGEYKRLRGEDVSTGSMSSVRMRRAVCGVGCRGEGRRKEVLTKVGELGVDT